MLIRLLCVVLFVGWTGEWPLDRDTSLYSGLWRSPFKVFGPLFVSIPGLNLVPWQLLLVVLTPFALIRPGALRGRSLVADATVITSVLSVALTFLWGWMRGSSAYQAYYQLWRFLAALLVCVLLNSVIRRSSDLEALGRTVVAAGLVRGSLAIYFYWAIVRGKLDPPPSYMTTHDDSLLFVGALLVVWSWAVASGHLRAWLASALISTLVLYAMVLNNRRLAWIELILALGLMYFLIPRRELRRRVNRWLVVAAPVLVVYFALGWGRTERIFAPVHALSTAGSVEDTSSLARHEEIRNLLYTLVDIGNPVLGTGWGVAYHQVTSTYTDFRGGFVLYPFQPHNSLLGVAVFAGLVGLFGMWLVVPLTAMLAMRGYLGAKRTRDLGAAIAVLCLLPAYGVQCYGDIGFQSLTCALLLGVAMGTAAKLSVWADAPATALRIRRRRA